jgi:hypothetical protein
MNGIVERAQRIALEDFWATTDLKGRSLADALTEWRTFFNWQHAHLDFLSLEAL